MLGGVGSRSFSRLTMGNIGSNTGGRVDAQVFPLNNSVTGSDPAALKLLMAGEIQ